MLLIGFIHVACSSGDGRVKSVDVLAQDSPAEETAAEIRTNPTVPIELAHMVRLRATDPVLQPLMPWPQEAEDAIASVRDDWAASAWKAPVGASMIEFNLLPLTGHPLELESLNLTFDGPPPDQLAYSVSATCAMPGDGATEWPDPTVDLDLAGISAGCLRLEAESTDGFVVADFSLVGSAPGLAESEHPVPEELQQPNHPDSGVVEGFFGVPWSWRERQAMIVHMARLGLGVYIHAPKSDPRHRAQWREPYPDEDMEQFQVLAELGDAVGVTVMAGISPFVDWGPDEEKDRALLEAKLQSFQAAGVRGFALLADDIEFEVEVPVDGALGAVHVNLANSLLTGLRETDPKALLWFVPTVYSDERADKWEGGLDYLEALAQLDPDIAVMWTGPGTSNATLVAEDFDRFVSTVGRMPVLWENYWANDGGDGFVGRLPLAPYNGRNPAVAGALGGVVVNPLIQGSLSRLAVTSAAAWLDDPKGYNASSAPALAAQMELPFTSGAAASPERDAELLELIQALFEADTLGSPGWQVMDGAIADLKESLEVPDSLPLTEVEALLPRFARLLTIEAELIKSGVGADLDDELLYPLRKVGHDGEAGLYALLALGDYLAGLEISPYMALAEEARTKSMFDRYMFSYGPLCQHRVRHQG